MSTAIRAEAARLVFAAWDCASVKYALLHGVEMDGEIGRDLDVLIAPGESRRVLSIARVTLERAGFIVAQPSSVWGARIVAARGEWETMIEFHTVPAVVWRNVIFAKSGGNITRHSGIPLDPWASFAKCVLLPLLSNPEKKFAATAIKFRTYAGNTEMLRAQCSFFFGAEHAAALFSALNSGDIALCDIPSIRRAAILRAAIRHPFLTLRYSAWQLLRRIIARFVPCAPIVAIVGPDGVGKSTLLAQIRSGSKSIFTDIVVRHWRPGVLPNLGGKRTKSTGSSAPRRHAGRWPWLRVFYYFWDYLLGHWLKDRDDTAHQRLVIYDRCALDMVVDPLRYGLSSQRAARWLSRLAPGPDAIILLTGDPSDIHERKPELSVQEITSQLAAWHELHTQGKIYAVVDAKASPEIVTTKVRELIISVFLHKLHATTPK